MELFNLLLVAYIMAAGFAWMTGGATSFGKLNAWVFRTIRKIIGGGIMWVGKQIAPPAPKKRRRP